MKLELNLNGELEVALERLAAQSTKADGSEVEAEEIAEQLLREAAASHYRELLLSA